ncbi:hypothetical protein ScPMuIL_006888 [Solemya velum]
MSRMGHGSRSYEDWIEKNEQYSHPRPYHHNTEDLYYNGSNWTPRGYIPTGQMKEMRESKRDEPPSSSSSAPQGRSFKRVVTRFSEKTSMQGVSYIHTSKRLIARGIWIFLLLASMAAMIFHLYFLFDQFFKWPKQTKITLGFSNLVFPALTLCNVNIIRKGELHHASPLLRKFADSLTPENLMVRHEKHNEPPPGGKPEGGDQNNGGQMGGDQNNAGQMGAREKRSLSALDDFNFTYYDDYDYEDAMQANVNEGEWHAPREQIEQREETFKRLYMKEKREARLRMGHHMQDMLVSCSFDGMKCYNQNFTKFQTREYGNCYTLDSAKLVAKASGPRNGLIMILYMENHEYLDGITTGYGARVVIHDRNTLPFPADEGIYVSTNMETHIGLKLVELSRMGQPHGTCEEGTAFKTKYNMTYSRQGCLSLCLQEKVLAQCGCYQKAWEEINRMLERGKKKPCKSQSELICMERALHEKTCTCPNPCKEEEYIQTVSSRQWPTEAYAELLRHTICSSHSAKCKNISKYTDDRGLSSNFLKLAIYFKDLNHETVEEEEEISVSQFLSDVGGALGLWIGLSVLSIFEVFQFFVELIEFTIWKCGNKSSDKDRHFVQRERQADSELERRDRDEEPPHYHNHGYRR